MHYLKPSILIFFSLLLMLALIAINQSTMTVLLVMLVSTVLILSQAWIVLRDTTTESSSWNTPEDMPDHS